MRVFISWSGEVSKLLAEALRQWLPAVVQAIKPYYSPDDITKGARWSGEIAKILDESRVGLICVTRNNLDAPWVMFEAGALSKNLDRSKVAPILFGVEPTDLTGPLVQFQAARFDKGEMKRIVRMINGELGEQRLASDVLDSVFDMWWPKLEENVVQILRRQEITGSSTVRPQRELLEEILTLTRAQAKRGGQGTISPRILRDLVVSYRRLTEYARSGDRAPELFSILEQFYHPIRVIARRSMAHDEYGTNDLLLEARRILLREPAEQVITEDEGELDL